MVEPFFYELEQHLLGTVLRRIPVPVVRAFERKGVELKIVRQRAEKLRKYLVEGLVRSRASTVAIVF